MTNPDPSTAIVRSPYNDCVAYLTKATPDFDRLLAPYGMSGERFRTTVLECLRSNPSLLKCEPLSVLRAAYYAAQVGLELGGPLGDAYLVPYKGQAKCIPGYRGLVHVAHDADPEIDHFDADVVYSADEYTEERGANPIFRVVPARFTADRGPAEGVYAICYYKPTQFGPRVPLWTVLRAAEVDAIRDASLAKLQEWQVRNSPWKNHEDEMRKKTALRRLVKLMNLRSTRAALTLALDAREHNEPREQSKSRAEDLKQKLGRVPEDVAEAEFSDDNDGAQSA